MNQEKERNNNVNNYVYTDILFASLTSANVANLLSRGLTNENILGSVLTEAVGLGVIAITNKVVEKVKNK